MNKTNLKQIDITRIDGTIVSVNMESNIDNETLKNELTLTLIEFMDCGFENIDVKSINIDNYDGGFETTVYFLIQNIVDEYSLIK